MSVMESRARSKVIAVEAKKHQRKSGGDKKSASAKSVKAIVPEPIAAPDELSFAEFSAKVEWLATCETRAGVVAACKSKCSGVSPSVALERLFDGINKALQALPSHHYESRLDSLYPAGQMINLSGRQAGNAHEAVIAQAHDLVLSTVMSTYRSEDARYSLFRLMDPDRVLDVDALDDEAFQRAAFHIQMRRGFDGEEAIWHIRRERTLIEEKFQQAPLKCGGVPCGPSRPEATAGDARPVDREDEVKSAPVPAACRKLTRSSPAVTSRNETFLRLHEELGMSGATIRDKWNFEHKEESIAKGKAGRSTVFKGIQSARKKRDADKNL
jgi:hypothetical protein